MDYDRGHSTLNYALCIGVISMQVNLLDVVALKDGRTGTVVEILSKGDVTGYCIEVDGSPDDLPIVEVKDISSVIWQNPIVAG